MKGLLLKDFYALKTYAKAFLVLAAILIIAGRFSDTTGFMLFYPCILSGLVSMTLLAYEEKDKWELYALTLPYSKAKLVSCKYLLSLIVGALTVLATCLVQLTRPDRPDVLGIFFTMMPLALLPTALLLPFLYKLGVEKGRLCYYVILGLFCALIPILNTGKALEGDAQAPTVLFGSSLVGGIVLAASALLFAVSWWLSIQFYKKREF